MWLPLVPLCTSSTGPRPRNNCLAINLAELASIRVASVASLNNGWCRPPKLALASAIGGITNIIENDDEHVHDDTDNNEDDDVGAEDDTWSFGPTQNAPLSSTRRLP